MTSVRAILSKITNPSCTPLAVAVAFIGGSVAGSFSGPVWLGLAIFAGIGVAYGLLLDVLRRVVKHRREPA